MGIKDEYKNYFDDEKNIADYLNFKRTLYGENDTLVTELAHYILQNTSFNQDIISICDLGGGDGKRILNICKLIQEKYPEIKFKLTLVEQANTYMRFIEQKLLDFFETVTFVNQEMEHFNSNEKFDLVLSIHSIYCLKAKEQIQKILNFATENGDTLIIVNHENSLLANIKQKLDEGYEEKRFEIDDLRQFFVELHTTFRRTDFDTIFTLTQQQIMEILDWMSLNKTKNNSKQENEKLIEFIKSFGEENNFVEKEIIFHL